MSGEFSPSPQSSTAMRRLLSSHHSVYNTLTDPLLECASPVASPDRHTFKEENTKLKAQKADKKQEKESTSTEESIDALSSHSPSPSPHPQPPRHEICAHLIEDPLASFSSWQALNLSTFQDITKSMRISSPFPYSSRPASASILSNSSDEDAPPYVPSDSLVLVAPSKRHASPHVLLFETDEEDGPDEEDSPKKRFAGTKSALEEGRPNITSSNSSRRTSVRTDSSQTFIMPRISLSENSDAVSLMIVCSSGALVKEVDFLADFLQGCSSRLNISQVSLELTPVAEQVLSAGNTDLLIVLNDGCTNISELTASIASTQDDTQTCPRLIVVNLLASNYFANLFEIMRNSRPQQCIKTSSLRNPEFLKKVKRLIEKELTRDESPYENHADPNDPCTSKMKCPKGGFCSSERMSSSIEKPDYRNMEKSIRSEMVFVPEYTAIDPLNLSVSLNRVCILGDVVSKFASGELLGIDFTEGSASRRDILWFFCSFSVGVGIGVALNAFQVFKIMKSTLFIDSTPPPAQILKSSKEFDVNAVVDKVSNFANSLAVQLDKAFSKVMNSTSKLDPWKSVSFDRMVRVIRVATDTACESAMHGLSKIRSFLGFWLE